LAPGPSDPTEAFDNILKAIEEEGYEKDFILALDAAATHMYDVRSKKYRYMGRKITREKVMDVYEELVRTVHQSEAKGSPSSISFSG
jgi:enolase